MPTTADECLDVTIFEQGNGFPVAGQIVADADGLLYTVHAITSPIHTSPIPGRNAWIYALVTEAPDDAPNVHPSRIQR